MARKSLSKKTRFEVFKRDGFVCQYCGAHPPEVVLHVDHIDAVAAGGTNDIDNLITACEPCNAGKGARALSAVPETLQNKAARLVEIEDQIAGFRGIQDAKRTRLEDDSWVIAAALRGRDEIDRFDRRDLASIRNFLTKLDFHSVLEFAELAYVRVPHSDYSRFKYFCGCCWSRIREPIDARS